MQIVPRFRHTEKALAQKRLPEKQFSRPRGSTNRTPLDSRESFPHQCDGIVVAVKLTESTWGCTGCNRVFWLKQHWQPSKGALEISGRQWNPLGVMIASRKLSDHPWSRTRTRHSEAESLSYTRPLDECKVYSVNEFQTLPVHNICTSYVCTWCKPHIACPHIRFKELAFLRFVDEQSDRCTAGCVNIVYC